MSNNGDDDYEYASPMEEAAISMHEMYVTLRRAGFTRRDALELVARMLVMGMNEVSDEEQYDTEDDE
jgi:hypothetical protein